MSAGPSVTPSLQRHLQPRRSQPASISGDIHSRSVTAFNTNGLYKPDHNEFQVVAAEEYAPRGVISIMIFAAIGCVSRQFRPRIQYKSI